MFKDLFTNRLFIIGGLVFSVFCIGGSLLYSWHVQRQEMRKLFEARERVAQWKEKQKKQQPAETPIEQLAEGGHYHTNGTWHNEPHAHISETPARAVTGGETSTDWRDDPAFQDALVKEDPWKQVYPQQTSTAVADDTYPPKDWSKTEDPVLRAEYFYAQLLKQFGDIPEVHTVGEYHLEYIASGKKRTYEIQLTYLEALYSLFPHESTAAFIEEIKQRKADGARFIFE